MPKRGRPRGLNINPVALEDFRLKLPMEKAELCSIAGITQGHLADMLRRQKGASPTLIRALATALQCRPESLAPELTGQFIAVRDGDVLPGEAA